MDYINLTHTGTVEIQTERLLLRRFVLGDANEMFREWASHENVTRYLTWDKHSSVSETKTFLMQRLNDYESPDNYFWAIQLKDEGVLIGSISAAILNERSKFADAGYCLGERFWGNGYASEALRAVMDYMIYDVKINRIESVHSVNNPKSGRVMQKAGMIYEGRCRQNYITGSGKYQDSDLYALVKEDFESNYKPGVKDFLDLGEIRLSMQSLSLKCTECYGGDKAKNFVPAYLFDITEKNSGIICGEINLRLGFNDNLYYGGHIGYTVYESFRNMGVATGACGIILELAKEQGFKKVIVTNNYTNKASRRVCEKIGGRLIRIAKLPEWHDLYIQGQRFVCIYEITL
ncbi:MAG: GNAT family N-acetyltransferase [Oscillospiraceae bacterium]|nr:GNAT family N-acetyltransferase [Oscillospiraceae bacterium]